MKLKLKSTLAGTSEVANYQNAQPHSVGRVSIASSTTVNNSRTVITKQQAATITVRMTTRSLLVSESTS